MRHGREPVVVAVVPGRRREERVLGEPERPGLVEERLEPAVLALGADQRGRGEREQEDGLDEDAQAAGTYDPSSCFLSDAMAPSERCPGGSASAYWRDSSTVCLAAAALPIPL